MFRRIGQSPDNGDSPQKLPGAELGGPVDVPEPISQEVDVAESRGAKLCGWLKRKRLS